MSQAADWSGEHRSLGFSLHKAGVFQTEAHIGALQIRALPGTADTCVGAREAGVWAYRGKPLGRTTGAHAPLLSHLFAQQGFTLAGCRRFISRVENTHLEQECFSLPPRPCSEPTTLPPQRGQTGLLTGPRPVPWAHCPSSVQNPQRPADIALLLTTLRRLPTATRMEPGHPSPHSHQA